MILVAIALDVYALTWCIQKIGDRYFVCGRLKSKLIYERRRLVPISKIWPY